MNTPISVEPNALDEPEPAHPLGPRLTSRDLFRQTKSIEIEHDGKIYQLRLTRLNKLILTA